MSDDRVAQADHPGAHPEEVVAMLDAIPDMRDQLTHPERTELAEIFVFAVTATYDKLNRRVELAATVTSELVAQHKRERPPGGGR
jgi:hypothetical protein